MLTWMRIRFFLQVFPLQRYLRVAVRECLLCFVSCPLTPVFLTTELPKHILLLQYVHFSPAQSRDKWKDRAGCGGNACQNKLDHKHKMAWQQNFITALLNAHMQTRHTTEALDKCWQVRGQTYPETCLPNKNLRVQNKPVHKAPRIRTIICNWYETWLET